MKERRDTSRLWATASGRGRPRSEGKAEFSPDPTSAIPLDSTGGFIFRAAGILFVAKFLGEEEEGVAT